MSEGALDEAHWSLEYPDCGGTRQSPIDLQVKKVQYNPSLRALNLTGYGLQHEEFPMTNNGHTGKDGRQTSFCPLGGSWGSGRWGRLAGLPRVRHAEMQSVAWGLQVLSPGTSSQIAQHLSVDLVPHSLLHSALTSLQAHSDPTRGKFSGQRGDAMKLHDPLCVLLICALV